MTTTQSPLWIFISLLFCLWAVSVQASRDTHFKETLSKLNLTADQQSKVTEITNAHDVEINKLKNDLKTKQDKLDSLLSNDFSSDEEINATRSTIDSLQEQLNEVKEEVHLSIKRLLSPEQKKQLRELHFSH